jgi:hypothetical protein
MWFSAASLIFPASDSTPEVGVGVGVEVEVAVAFELLPGGLVNVLGRRTKPKRRIQVKNFARRV